MIERIAPPTGWLAVTVWRRGRAERRLCGPNAIVGGMFTTMALLLGGGACSVQGAVGVGSSDPAPSDAGLSEALLLPATALVQGVVCRFFFELPPAQGNGLQIAEYGLFAGDALIARTTRSSILKADDIALACDWQIDFSGGV